MDQAASARRDANCWFGLAIGALALAGVLAIVLVIGRVPALGFSSSGVDFARRSLVVHVDLAVGVWFFAFLAALFCLLPGAARGRWVPFAAIVSGCGVVTFALPIASRTASPVLSNYVPVLDHGLFLAGLVLFAIGVSASFLDRRLVSDADHRSVIPPEARPGIRIAAFAFLIAMATIVVAYVTRDPSAPALPRFERLFWGGGHVLQTSEAIAMLAAWLILLDRVTGRSAMSPRFATIVFGAMLIPTLFAPALALGAEPSPWFTTMMELGIAPGVAVVVWRGIAVLRQRKTHVNLRSPAMIGLAVSVVMTLIGFVFGAAISTNTTLVPAHYHMNIGAVTVTFMTLLVALAPTFGAPVRNPRLACWQPVIYGIGQTLFATGLGVAGFWGHAARKVYDHEPQLGTHVEHGGLILAGIGGVIAMAGGVLFFIVIIRAWTQRRR
ncbi:MAG: cbb3-type cytochrome c oxidase subunit I [Kofleriaceae bacterium]